MSFQNAGQALQKFLLNRRYAVPPYASIRAMLNAAQMNTSLSIDRRFPIDPRLRAVKVTYYPIVCNAVSPDNQNSTCSDATKQQPVSEFFYITRQIKSLTYELDTADVRYIDPVTGGQTITFADHVNAQILAVMGDLRRELAEQIDSLLFANAGLLNDGNATARISIINGQTGQINPLGLWDIETQFEDLGLTNPIILGGKDVNVWRKAYSIAAVNNTTGMDYTKLSDQNIYYDEVIDRVGGDIANGGHILAFSPQVVRFVTYSLNAGMFATDLKDVSQLDRLYQQGGTDYMRGTFVDPQDGLLWDLDIDFDPCGGPDKKGAFKWVLSLWWDIWFMSLQACAAQGVNGIYHFRTCPAVQVPCPTGSPVQSPAAATDYSWTPGDIFPLYIAKATIGNVNSEPQVSVSDIDDLVNAMNDAYGSPGFFEVDGADVVYTGYKALSGNLNDGTITITFA